MNHDAIRQHLLTLHAEISDMVLRHDTKAFQIDPWQHDSGGGGLSQVLEGGTCFERGGVNFSHISGTRLPPAILAAKPELAEVPFEAMGISVVLHPQNPYVPTAHLNVRFFGLKEAPFSYWFGGGFDLTPYYGFEEDCVLWHRAAKAACDPVGEDIYQQFKINCDQYFYLPHRQEPRGIGGIFFDYFTPDDLKIGVALLERVARGYATAYETILQRRKALTYGEHERSFQLYRRGRYVEFNLLYDRGTHFGLQSKGRTESILMSLPPSVNWRYDYQPEPGSAEAKLYEVFLQPRAWID